MKIKLTKRQKAIYDAVLKSFPATSKWYALGVAIEDGIRFDFTSKS
jgi:hypothetical protein